ncbi:MAG: 2-oxo acid dehydrogenase subunit E2, partial [Acidimicrobiia bacterium]
MPQTTPTPDELETAGPNAWLIDEMRERWQHDPESVGESWRDFFSGSTPMNGHAVVSSPAAAPTPPAPAAPAAPASAPESRATTPGTSPATTPSAPIAPRAPAAAEPLRGAAARIVTNMEASLAVPTATSFREVATKLLEVNRKSINGYLSRSRAGKVSFTHLIGYAVVRAIVDAVPAMNSTFVTDADGKPCVIRNEHLGLGLAVDVEKAGGRTLLVPCISAADTLDFAGFFDAYETIIRKVRSNTLSPDDFAGVTVTLTNPGTIGTVQSVPRLMPGQGVIVGVGSLDHPTAFRGADPATIAALGLSRVMTITSTYDHRIIQGAESGLFLKHVQELLMG